MLQLENKILSGRSLGYLKKWQDQIDGERDFPAQAEKAAKLWGKSNKTFDEIKATLTLMCNGAKRCAYCEDSVADEVEHIFPKKVYPNKTFVWENYLYACGPCNGPKSAKFAIFDAVR